MHTFCKGARLVPKQLNEKASDVKNKLSWQQTKASVLPFTGLNVFFNENSTYSRSYWRYGYLPG